jgi:hypothetical protein
MSESRAMGRRITFVFVESLASLVLRIPDVSRRFSGEPCICSLGTGRRSAASETGLLSVFSKVLDDRISLMMLKTLFVEENVMNVIHENVLNAMFPDWSKKPYKAPLLSAYGDLRQITLNVGNKGKHADGGTGKTSKTS